MKFLKNYKKRNKEQDTFVVKAGEFYYIDTSDNLDFLLSVLEDSNYYNDHEIICTFPYDITKVLYRYFKDSKSGNSYNKFKLSSLDESLVKGMCELPKKTVTQYLT